MDQNNKGNYYNRDNWDNKAPEGGDGDEGEPEAEVTGQAEPEAPEGGDEDEGEPEVTGQAEPEEPVAVVEAEEVVVAEVAEVTGQAEPEEPVEVAEVEEEAVAVVEAEVLQEQTVVV